MSRMACGRCNPRAAMEGGSIGYCEKCLKYGAQACWLGKGWPCCPNCREERRPGWIDR